MAAGAEDLGPVTQRFARQRLASAAAKVESASTPHTDRERRTAEDALVAWISASRETIRELKRWAGSRRGEYLWAKECDALWPVVQDLRSDFEHFIFGEESVLVRWSLRTKLAVEPAGPTFYAEWDELVVEHLQPYREFRKQHERRPYAGSTNPSDRYAADLQMSKTSHAIRRGVHDLVVVAEVWLTELEQALGR